MLPRVLEGPELIFGLSGAALGKPQTKKCEPKLLVSSTDIADLAELVNAGLN